MVACCHEPLFVVFAFSYAPGSRPYEKKKYLRQITFSINLDSFSINIPLH
jgi:hypothetical protein